MACVGVIGGLGVGATIHYYEKITASCKARGMVPDLVIAHADVDYGQGLVRAGKLDELAGYLASFIDRMARAGAAAAAIPAVTPHICIAQLTQRTRVPLINIVDRLNAAMRKIARMDVTMQRANQLGTVLKDWTPAEMDTFARKEVADWGKVIRDNNITMD